MNIGTIVRKRRKANNLTLGELAALLPDYDAGNLSRFETGKQYITEEKLLALASALGTTVSSMYIEAEGGAPLPESKRKLINTILIAEISEEQARLYEQLIKNTIA